MSGTIVESALLTHGLASIASKDIKKDWKDGWKIAWLESGRLRVGEVDEFCVFRSKAADLKRINYFSYEEACRNAASGPLTASGTMRAAEETGVPCVVTCGIGGIRPGENAEASNDISAMKQSDISLVASAFKDMFDTDCSISAAEQSSVNVCRLTDYWHRGYIFKERARQSSADTAEPPKAEEYRHKTLYLLPAPETQLINDSEILEEAVRYGKEAAQNGQAFHPAVNRRIDELTEGYSSVLQLFMLIENIKAAEELIIRIQTG